MTEPKDTELQRYLDGDSALSRRYRRASVESPPPELDDAILKAARDAVTARARRRPSRWAVPLALAATTLLGVNLVWLLRDDAVPQAPRRAVVAQKAEAPPPAPMTADEAAAASGPPAAPAASPPTPVLADAASRTREQASNSAAAAEPMAPAGVGATAQAGRKATRAEADAAESRRAASELERQALRTPPAEPSLAAPSAPSLGKARMRDDSADIERHAQSLAALLRAGDLAGVRAGFGAIGIGDAQLMRLAALLKQRELRPRVEQDGVWQIDCVGPEGDVACVVYLRNIDGNWRLVDVTSP